MILELNDVARKAVEDRKSCLKRYEGKIEEALAANACSIEDLVIELNRTEQALQSKATVVATVVAVLALAATERTPALAMPMWYLILAIIVAVSAAGWLLSHIVRWVLLAWEHDDRQMMLRAVQWYQLKHGSASVAQPADVGAQGKVDPEPAADPTTPVMP